MENPIRMPYRFMVARPNRWRRLLPRAGSAAGAGDEGNGALTAAVPQSEGSRTIGTRTSPPKTRKEKSPAAMRLAAGVAPVEREVTRAGWLSVVAALLWLVMAAVVAWLFGALVEGRATGGDVALAVAVFVGVGAARAALGWWSARLLDDAADRLIAGERTGLIARQERLSPRAARLSSAALGAMLADKLPHLVPFVRRYRPAALRVAVVPVVLLLVSLPLSWVVALILLVAGPLIPLFMALVGMAAREASERQMEEIGSLSGLLAERLAALTDIRLLDARTRMLAEFEDRSRRLRDRTMAVLKVAFLSSAVLELFAALGVAMVAVYVGFSLLGELRFGAWGSGLTPAEGVFLLMIAPEFFQPLRDLAAAWHDRAAALAVAGELAELEATPPVTILGQGGPGAAGSGGASEITLSGLSLGATRYPDLRIRPGESVAFTGRSGSGKSTLIDLIGGLETPSTGQILIGGVPLNADTADDWRAEVAWVPQAARFQAGPLRDTLLVGAPPDVTGQDIAAALSLASAEGVVARLPGGLDGILGEAGGGVSGGEARRLMLARAALSNRPVLLADEPTADLDAETASDVIAALRALNAGGTTVIVATHDPALASAMSRQVALDSPEGARS